MFPGERLAVAIHCWGWATPRSVGHSAALHHDAHGDSALLPLTDVEMGSSSLVRTPISLINSTTPATLTILAKRSMKGAHLFPEV